MSRVTLLAPDGRRDPGSQGLIAATEAALGEDFQVSRWEVSRAPLSSLRRGTAVVAVGGTPLALGADGVPVPALRRLNRLVPLARALGDPLVLLGVGVSLGPGDPRPIVAVSERADLLVLRDEQSAACLRAAGATPPFRVGADPTWTLLDRAGVVGAERVGGQGVMVVPDAPGRRAREVMEVLARLGRPARLLGWGSPPGTPAAGAGPLVDACRALGGAELVISLRLHGLIAAAAAGVACLALGPDPGLSDLAGRLGQAWVPEVGAPAHLGEALELAKGVGSPGHTAVMAEVARAEEGFRLARLLISRGRSEEAETLVGLPWAERPWV